MTPRVRFERDAKIYFYWSANGGGKTASNLVYPRAKDERRRVEDEAERRAVLISEALRFGLAPSVIDESVLEAFTAHETHTHGTTVRMSGCTAGTPVVDGSSFKPSVSPLRAAHDLRAAIAPSASAIAALGRRNRIVFSEANPPNARTILQERLDVDSEAGALTLTSFYSQRTACDGCGARASPTTP